MKFEIHPDKKMGLIWLPNAQPIGDKEVLHAFPLSDDEKSIAYLAWVAEGNTPEEWTTE